MVSQIVKKEYQFLETKFGDTPAYTFIMKVKDMVQIYYVAVRGVDFEEGSVQRILSKSRVDDIKRFVLEGHTFFNSFILNWTDINYYPEFEGNLIKIPIVNFTAQVIDGQHRISGYELAMSEDETVGNRDMIVTLCLNLTTPKAAEIFLNINTEQKPVPKSLMYDLFGEVVNDEAHSINRATDIARYLNEEIDSPLYKFIRFPGSPKGQGSVELSTFVSALKEHLIPQGTFYNYKLTTFDHQKNVINNFFQTIKNFYSENNLWYSKTKNPFLKASGLNGALDFLTSSLVQRCAEKSSFTIESMSNIISFDKNEILTADDLKNLDGKTSKKRVREALEANLLKSLPNNKDYEF